MVELQPGSMQRLALESAEGLDELGAGARRKSAAAPIEWIAYQWIADVGEVNANLMRAPGLQFNTHEGMSPEPLHDAIVGDGRAAIRPHSHPCTHTAMAADRLINRSAPGHHAGTERNVLPLDLVFREGGNQCGVSLGRPGDDKQATGIFVEAVNEPGARHDSELRIERQQCILQGMARVAGARVNDQSRRLVDHEQGAILKHHLQRQGLRRDALVALEPCLDAHSLPAQHLVAWSRATSIHLDRPGVDPALQPGPRILR